LAYQVFLNRLILDPVAEDVVQLLVVESGQGRGAGLSTFVKILKCTYILKHFSIKVLRPFKKKRLPGVGSIFFHFTAEPQRLPETLNLTPWRGF
jgi:hypothetical protein